MPFQSCLTLLLHQLKPSNMTFLSEREPPPPISTPWEYTGHKAASRCSEPFGMHIIPPLTVTTGTHFTYPQRDGGLSQCSARLCQDSVGIEPGTSHMKVCFSTNWAILFRCLDDNPNRTHWNRHKLRET